jgi:hypothetical protein
LGELSRQTFHQMLLQPSPAHQQLALSSNETKENCLPLVPRGPMHSSQNLLHNEAPNQQESARSISAYITNKRLEC